MKKERSKKKKKKLLLKFECNHVIHSIGDKNIVQYQNTLKFHNFTSKFKRNKYKITNIQLKNNTIQLLMLLFF